MDLDETAAKSTSEGLKDDAPLPSIWSFDENEKTQDEDRFDKPSFLRRLRRHKKDDSKTDDKDKS